LTLKWRRGAVVVLQTDKASMLDEIIDYVKFLQLQVKVMLLLLNIAADEW
jgi:hypothetical protein